MPSSNPPPFIGGSILGGTSGSILYVNSLGQLAQDNSNLFWDATNKRLGIGLAVPLAGLHVGATPNPTGGTVNDVVVGGRVLITDQTGINFTTGRQLELRPNITTNGLTLINVQPLVSGLSGAASGTLTGMQMAIAGTPGYTSGSFTLRGFFFTSTFIVPTGVTCAESVGAIFQSSSATNGGTITKSTGVRAIVLGTNSASTTPTIYGFESQVASRNATSTILAAYAISQGSGGFSGATTDFVGYDFNTNTGDSSTVTNWSAFRCTLTPTNPTGTKYVFNITSTLASIHAGQFSIGTTTAPTANVMLGAGTASANTAPLKFNSGALLTTAEAGAIEFYQDGYYATVTTSATRQQIATDLNIVCADGDVVTSDDNVVLV